MTEKTAETAKQSSDEQRAVRELLDHCELTNVRLLEVHAKRHSFRSTVANAQLQMSGGFQAAAGTYANRFDWTVSLLADDDETVGVIHAVFLVEYAVEDGYEPDPQAADYVAGTVGRLAAYPYVREIVQSTAARLGLAPVVLGLLAPGAYGPDRVNVTVDAGASPPEHGGS